MLEHYSRYEEVSPGLGDRFYARVNEGLSRLLNFPEIAPSYAKPFRRLLLMGFPVGVFYVFEGGRVVVHAMLDLRQSPVQRGGRKFEDVLKDAQQDSVLVY